MSDAVERVEILIVGSGAGGAVTATRSPRPARAADPRGGPNADTAAHRLQLDGRDPRSSTATAHDADARSPVDRVRRRAMRRRLDRDQQRPLAPPAGGLVLPWKADELLTDFTPEIMERTSSVSNPTFPSRRCAEQVPKSSRIFRGRSISTSARRRAQSEPDEEVRERSHVARRCNAGADDGAAPSKHGHDPRRRFRVYRRNRLTARPDDHAEHVTPAPGARLRSAHRTVWHVVIARCKIAHTDELTILVR